MWTQLAEIPLEEVMLREEDLGRKLRSLSP